ncbi:PREDICTED: dentin sialophosphoprotein [Ceratosolen solmsi marchali]|uniref:Dentin sialophosphoprotein n=1 Tax=Ceratosolen solmsi marchali TaxID=326594 RepID=A0AAJ7DXK3_9HYME|nr:PREDICTED: dentin sialophosphoprotein [Ceratosolen solmsi marchali]
MPAGGNSRFRGYSARMSERQQLALLLQMTSQEMTSGTSGRSESTIPLSNARSSPLHQKASKSRWSNKNADLLDVNTTLTRQDERLRLVNGCNSKEQNGSDSPDEVRTATGAESPVAAGSPAECAAAERNDPDVPSSSTSSQLQAGRLLQHAEGAGTPYEMRRTPPQNKVDRQATGGSGQQQPGGGSSGRVTLRLNQVRATRDEKKGTAGAQGTSAAVGGQGNASSRQSAGSSSSLVSPVNRCNNSSSSSSSSSSSADGGDVYEFKSSKEATPVRGSSSSPNPNPEKDNKDGASAALSASSANSQGSGVGAAGVVGSAGPAGVSGNVGPNITSSSVASSTISGGPGIGTSSSSGSAGAGGGSAAEALASSVSSAMPDEPMITTTSPAVSVTASSATKRAFDSESAQADEQDEEGRKRKKKDTEPGKDTAGGVKAAASCRQAASRSSAAIAEKCTKSGKQAAGAMSAKGGQNSSSVNTDRKSPSATLSANSPKPSNSSAGSTANNPKGGTPSNAESDGEDERSKNSDCNSAPKVPPLKIVIPQSTTSEQEQGNRNGKSTCNRGHQLPYVVASSNSNDSMDKEQGASAAASGTTSPLENSVTTSKSDEKKDFSGALDNESRSTHHQRVLRSSHRSGNGANNGATASREASSSLSGNGSYANSSPLPANAADRSNNSSPQQRHHSPTPESSGVSEAGKSASMDSPAQSSPAIKSSNAADKCEKSGEVKKEVGDTSDGSAKKDSGGETPNSSAQAPVELHPRKRKMKTSKEAQQAAATAAANETPEATSTGPEIHPHDQPITNCYQLFLNIRKQIERRRKGLFPVQPKPPQGFKDYLMNRCTYVLAGNANKEPNINPPVNLLTPMKDLYVDQEKERYRLRMQHVVEKEKLVLSVEQEILRVHGRAARALANQSLPFSVCTILKDEEVYNVITPEQEEKDRNARSRYNGRLFLSWLQDVDDKWEKIKEAMLLRHHNEAESLHAVQRMDWEWKLKEVGLCEFKVTPQIEDLHVPMVHVSDDFDLLPA